MSSLGARPTHCRRHTEVHRAAGLERQLEGAGSPHVFLEIRVAPQVFQILEAPPPIGRAHEHALVREGEGRQIRDGLELHRVRPQRDTLHHGAMFTHQTIDGTQRHERLRYQPRRLLAVPRVGQHDHVRATHQTQRAFERELSDLVLPARQRILSKALQRAIAGCRSDARELMRREAVRAPGRTRRGLERMRMT